MLILGSYGFGYERNRLEIGELIEDKSGSMLIVPLASGTEIGEMEKDCAAMLGFKKENIFVFDDSAPDPFLNRSYDHIVVPGGNTFMLLYYVRKYHLDSFIKQQVADGATYLGFSAGAYLACGNIEYVKIFDDNNHITDGNFTALELTDKYVLCHSDDRGFQEIKMCRQFIGDESELLMIRNDRLIVL